MNRGVVDEHAPLLHHFPDMTETQRVGYVPAYTHQHDLQRVVHPLDHLAQLPNHRTSAEIYHVSDCPLSLLRQSRHPPASMCKGWTCVGSDRFCRAGSILG